MKISVLLALITVIVTGQAQLQGDEPAGKSNVKADSRDIKSEKTPSFTGKVIAVAADGKSLTL